MKIKNILSTFAFITFFSLSLIGTIFTSSVFSGVFHKESSPLTQAKIYHFLRRDLQNTNEKLQRIENRAQDDHVAFINALRDYGEKSEKMKTNDLPEDFQIAWKKYSTTEREWADFLTHLESMPDKTVFNKAEKEIADKKISEEQMNWNNVLSIAKSYGIAFDDKDNLIEK